MYKNQISIIIFISAFLLSILGLSTNMDNFYNNLVFWLSNIILIIIIIYQILYLERKMTPIILIEIMALGIILHLLYQVGYVGLRGSDSYLEFSLLKSIIRTGFFNISLENNSWPFLHILTSEIGLILNIEPLFLAKFFPSVFSSLIILIVFNLINKIYCDAKTALLSCLILTTIPTFISFESLFVKEIIGLFILIFMFYLVYSYSKGDNRFIYLIVITIPALILSHHFSSFLFIIMMLIYTSITLIKKIINIYKSRNDNPLKFNLNNLYFLITVSLLAYWVYVGTLVMKSFTKTILEVIGVNEYITYSQEIGFSSPIMTLRGEIIYYGFFFFIFTFLMLQLVQNIKNENNKPEEYVFTLFFIFCGIYGFIAFFVSGSLINADRLLTFAWIFGIIPVVAIYFKNKGLRFAKKPIIIFLTAFMIFNLYNIDPAYINKDLSTIGLASDVEYAIAENFIFPDTFFSNNADITDYKKAYYGYGGVIGAIYDIQGIEQRTKGRDALNLNLNDSKYIVIINENMYTKDILIIEKKSPDIYNQIMKLLMYKNSENANKLADLGKGIYILEGR